jgi:hypothetical protein
VSSRDCYRDAHLVEVDVHALELQVRGAVVDTGAVESMLAGDGLPEGSTDLVTLRGLVFVSMGGVRWTYALAGLEVNLLHAGSLAVVPACFVDPENAGSTRAAEMCVAAGIHTISRMVAVW